MANRQVQHQSDDHSGHTCNHANAAPCPTGRRSVLASIIAVAALPAVTAGATAHAAANAPIAPPEDATPEGFMRRAFDMRQFAVDQGDRAYGAVIVRGGRIIGQSGSRVIVDSDPTAHAELATIRDAAQRLGDRDLSGAVMYSSSRPCPMCEAAAFWANIDEMIHGTNLTSAGAPTLCR